MKNNLKKCKTIFYRITVNIYKTKTKRFRNLIFRNFNVMQRNLPETLSKLSSSTDNVAQQPFANATQFPRAPSSNRRFVVTPESMDMNLHSGPSTSRREQQPQCESSIVDVKSYYERHNKSSMCTLANCKDDSHESFYYSRNTRSQSNASLNANNVLEQVNESSKTELMEHSLSPNTPPQIPTQQWNFEVTMNNECPQLNLKYQASNKNCVQSLCDQLSNATKSNFVELNSIFAKRIEDIDANAWGDKDLKICTYQEWVELLTKIGESFITNMEGLEREISDRLELMQKRATGNCRHSQGNELMKCRKDIDTLLKYIRNARNGNQWDLRGLTFETISPDQVLDMADFHALTIDDNGGDEMKDYNDPDFAQKNKLYANMRALALEVAEKHDEVRELKRQVICLEDEIQKAQKKIQLKDDVIKELRNDLKCANNRISNNSSQDAILNMPPINFENQTSRDDNALTTENASTSHIDNASQFDSLSHTELEEQQTIKLLEEELSSFFEINHELNKQKIENQRVKIMNIIEKQETEKTAAYRKLDFIRRQLIDLESDSIEGNNDCDSGFHSKSDNDQDAKLLNAVRKRLQKLNETNCELKKKIQKLELENSEFSSNLQMEKGYSERNGKILKELADLLCDMKGKFSYTKIYDTTSKQMNPFCEAIMQMQRDFQEKEQQLLSVIEMRNKQCEELLNKENDFNEGKTERLDIDKISATLLTTSSQPLPAITSTTTRPPQIPSPTLTGQQLADSRTTTSLDRLVDKQ